jgi:plasmid rolling circle replication initiator protein Rep
VFYLLLKYTEKKNKNQVTAEYTDKHVSVKTQRRIYECGNWMEWLADSEVVKTKVHQANFCKNRFCPMCMWRQAKKDALKIGVMMDYIEQEYEKAFVFVTLTAPNVKGEELTGEITRYNRAFKKMVERDVVSRMNHGYMRKLEITYNPKRNDYHTHFHCVFAVDGSYFKSRNYLKQERWLNHWRDVMNDQSITQVDVRRIKKGGVDGRDGGVNEIAKYAAKDSDYTYSQDVFDSFYKALKGRQVLTFNGMFTEANKKYKAGELDKYKNRDDTEYCYMLLYRWGKNEYIEKERRVLTEVERKAINRQLTLEIDIEE